MLHLSLRKLSSHQQQLYTLIFWLVAGGFLLGVLWVLLGFSDGSAEQDSVWSETSIPVQIDNAGLQQVIAQKPRWFQEKDTKAGGQAGANAIVAGTPESFRVVGLVTRGHVRYALFLPLANSGGAKDKPTLIQRAEGELLVGNWIVKTIAPNQVEVQQGDVIRTLKIYDPVQAPKAKSRRAR